MSREQPKVRVFNHRVGAWGAAANKPTRDSTAPRVRIVNHIAGRDAMTIRQRVNAESLERDAHTKLAIGGEARRQGNSVLASKLFSEAADLVEKARKVRRGEYVEGYWNPASR